MDELDLFKFGLQGGFARLSRDDRFRASLLMLDAIAETVRDISPAAYEHERMKIAGPMRRLLENVEAIGRVPTE
jgi:hypothetical protein